MLSCCEVNALIMQNLHYSGPCKYTSISRLSVQEAEAVRDFAYRPLLASEEEEEEVIHFDAGEKLLLLGKYDDDWWVGYSLEPGPNAGKDSYIKFGMVAACNVRVVDG